MAILKLFGSSSSRSPSPAALPALRITHHVPAFGGIYLPPPSLPVTEHIPEIIYGGRLEVFLPPGSGRSRCKSIKIGFRTTSTLDLGPKRGKEEDVVFERSIVLDEGTILEEGSQFFEWNISIPRSLAAHDWHPEGKVVHTIFAEVEGEAPRGRRRAASPRRAFSTSSSVTPAGSRSGSPSPLSTPAVEKPPEYAYNRAPEREPDREKVSWLKGRYEGKRSLMIIHENPGGGVMDLDMRGEGAVPGLGVYNLRFTSDVWTVCALLRFQLNVPDPSPKATIYAIKMYLEQTTHAASPRDGPDAVPISRLRPFEVCSVGKAPHPQQRLSKDVPALWSGSEKDTCELEGYARLPDDEFARPSTPEGIETPLRVSHCLVMEIWFAVQGEDEWGQPCEEYKTRVRTLTLRKAVMIPSCALIPEFVDLPTYSSVHESTFPSRTDLPCVLCRRNIPPNDYKASVQLAKQRYQSDQPGQLPEGKCKICGRNFVLPGSGMWRDCACGQSLGEMQERMKKVDATEGTIGESNQQPKEERGRSR